MEKTLSENSSKKLSGLQRLLEAGLLTSFVASMFLMLALFTFNPADPSWSQTGHIGPVRNAAGPLGAYLSDIFLFFFGVVAYTLPFIVAISGWLLFQKIHHLIKIDYLTLGLKFIGFLLLFVGVTALTSMNMINVFDNYSAGGLLGDVISRSGIQYLGFIGATLLFLLFSCAGFVFLTGLSWLYLIDKLGEKTIAASVALTQLPQWLKLHFNSNPIASEEQLEQKHSVDNREQDSVVQSNVFKKQEPVFVEPKLDESEFVEIEDIFDEPLTINIQDDVSEEAIDAAFAEVSPVDVEDDEVELPQPKPTKTQAVTADTYDSMPSIDLLDRPDKNLNPINQEELDQVSRLVELKLLDFGVEANVVSVYPGPVITRFELDLAPGVKVSKISNLSKDLARSLSAISVRVVEVIPGKSVIGLELPNKHREIVRLSEVISCDKFEKSTSPLTMVLGKDIAGAPIVVDLGKMPHLLVAGTTGSGKSVGVNTMIVSLLYKSTPEDVRLIMIDPKMLELSVYEGIPHLLTEVVTDMKEAANALRWCVGEMERRYKLMSLLGVRNLKGYNQKIAQGKASGQPITDPLWKPGESMATQPPELDKLPSIVVIVDEFADMIMIVGKKVEELIARIAQKARAAGIHLILATQRPSVDVITGLIKANIPTRMAFQVSSRVDSRTILDQQGAEQLLGQGDMLYLPPGSGVPTRVHGAFVDDHEVHAVVSDWKQRGEPNYLDEILSGDMTQETLLPGEQVEGDEDDTDVLYDEALMFVTETRRASISGVQRKFKIGYNRAARIIEQMEQQGVVSSQGHNGSREVLAPPPVK